MYVSAPTALLHCYTEVRRNLSADLSTNKKKGAYFFFFF